MLQQPGVGWDVSMRGVVVTCCRSCNENVGLSELMLDCQQVCL